MTKMTMWGAGLALLAVSIPASAVTTAQQRSKAIDRERDERSEATDICDDYGNTTKGNRCRSVLALKGVTKNVYARGPIGSYYRIFNVGDATAVKLKNNRLTYGLAITGGDAPHYSQISIHICKAKWTKSGSYVYVSRKTGASNQDALNRYKFTWNGSSWSSTANKPWKIRLRANRVSQAQGIINTLNNARDTFCQAG